MPDIGAYFGHRTPDTEVRAALAWQRILDNPTSITLHRLGTPQTVRIEYHAVRGREGDAATGSVAQQAVTVFGVQGHRTVTDTDIRRGDRFVLNDEEYDVVLVTSYPGEVQAVAERIS